jgi:hypothetical protein
MDYCAVKATASLTEEQELSMVKNSTALDRKALYQEIVNAGSIPQYLASSAGAQQEIMNAIDTLDPTAPNLTVAVATVQSLAFFNGLMPPPGHVVAVDLMNFCAAIRNRIAQQAGKVLVAPPAAFDNLQEVYDYVDGLL